MTSILSAISGKFSPSLILGTFAPVAAFVVLALICVLPLVPVDFPFLQPLEGLDVTGKLISITLAIIILSLILYNLNIPIIRWYEGYPWRDWPIGEWRSRYYRHQLAILKARFVGMRALRSKMAIVRKRCGTATIETAVRTWIEIPAANEVLKTVTNYVIPAPTLSPIALAKWDALYEQSVVQSSAIGRRINNEFPPEPNILPTHLGNVIASFENYSRLAYGMDAIVLWPRLVAKLPADFAALVDDAKTAFDFMLNCSVLSLLLALAIAITGFVFPPAPGVPLLLWTIFLFSFAFLTWWSYELSISRASAWGDMVKSVFDLYKKDLLTALGYKRDALARDDERTLWRQISGEILYNDLTRITVPEYTPAPETSPPIAQGTPDSVSLRVTRGAWPLQGVNAVAIVLSIYNPDTTQTVTDVVVKDQVEDNLFYEWGSAEVDHQIVPAEGVNPYKFHIGDITPQTDKVLVYIAIPRSLKAKGGAE